MPLFAACCALGRLRARSAVSCALGCLVRARSSSGSLGRLRARSAVFGVGGTASRRPAPVSSSARPSARGGGAVSSTRSGKIEGARARRAEPSRAESRVCALPERSQRVEQRDIGF